MAKTTPQAAHIALPRRQDLLSISNLMILGGFLLIYRIIHSPFGQVLQRFLKFYSFRKLLRKAESEQFAPKASEGGPG